VHWAALLQTRLGRVLLVQSWLVLSLLLLLLLHLLLLLMLLLLLLLQLLLFLLLQMKCGGLQLGSAPGGCCAAQP
jgi:hypothetical protein